MTSLHVYYVLTRLFLPVPTTSSSVPLLHKTTRSRGFCIYQPDFRRSIFRFSGGTARIAVRVCSIAVYGQRSMTLIFEIQPVACHGSKSRSSTTALVTCQECRCQQPLLRAASLDSTQCSTVCGLIKQPSDLILYENFGRFAARSTRRPSSTSGRS